MSEGSRFINTEDLGHDGCGGGFVVVDCGVCGCDGGGCSVGCGVGVWWWWWWWWWW